MPRPSALLLGTLPVALLGILYYEHRRLQSSYPTLRVPLYFEISARRDRPAFGMSGANDGGKSRPGEPWMNTHAGDLWTATIPRRLLSPPSEEEDAPLIVFARAFLTSWPLRLERHILNAFDSLGILYQTRGGTVGAEGERRLINTARVMGGFGVIEAQGSSDPQSGDAPLVVSWWLRPLAVSDTRKPGLLGGYHSFAIEDDRSPLNSNSKSPVGRQEPTVRVSFISHLIFSPPYPTAAPSPDLADNPHQSSSTPTSELRGLSLSQELVMWFHTLYSRILLDLAVRGLERGMKAG
ncbi:hypothetical protein DFH09DRAFT_1276103 [Mycena vulgaris]|nr:hypothetical protein DFH09DRAFT_1276103 [Mycena vulgaris]